MDQVVLITELLYLFWIFFLVVFSLPSYIKTSLFDLFEESLDVLSISTAAVEASRSLDR